MNKRGFEFKDGLMLPIQGGGDGPGGNFRVLTGGYENIPTLAAPISITSGTNALSAAWVQIVAAVTGAKWLYRVSFACDGTWTYGEFAIATGAASSEVEQLRVRAEFPAATSQVRYGTILLPYPVLIPHNSRLAVKASSSAAIVFLMSVGLIDAVDLVEMR